MFMKSTCVMWWVPSYAIGWTRCWNARTCPRGSTRTTKGSRTSSSIYCRNCLRAQYSIWNTCLTPWTWVFLFTSYLLAEGQKGLGRVPVMYLMLGLNTMLSVNVSRKSIWPTKLEHMQCRLERYRVLEGTSRIRAICVKQLLYVIAQLLNMLVVRFQSCRITVKLEGKSVSTKCWPVEYQVAFYCSHFRWFDLIW